MLATAETDPAPLTLAAYIDNSRANNFNLLRLIAAAAVIYGHAFALSLNVKGQRELFGPLLGFTYSGSMAVDVFFLISGVFVTQSLYHEPDLFRFVVKRFLRIWPGLIVCLLISAMMAAIVSTYGFTDTLRDPKTYLYVLRNSILRMQWTIPGAFNGRPESAINGSLWTLPLEATMYAIVIVAGTLGFLSSRSGLLAFALFLALTMLIFPDKYVWLVEVTSPTIVTHVLFFLAGMVIFAVRDVIVLRVRHIICVVALAWFANGIAFEVLFYLAVGWVTLWIGCSELVARIPRPRGDYSFGVYIYGWPAEQLVAVLWPAARPYQMFVVALALALSFAVASWHLVERPAQRLGRNVPHLPTDWRWLTTRRWQGWDRAVPFFRTNWRGIAIPVAALVIAMTGFAATEAAWRLGLVAPPDPAIVAFGPTPVTHGQPFNVQPNGQSAIWVRLDRPADPNDALQIGGKDLSTAVGGDLLTALVPSSLVAQQGSLPLLVKMIRNGRVRLSEPVAFVVQ